MVWMQYVPESFMCWELVAWSGDVVADGNFKMWGPVGVIGSCLH